MSSLSQPPAEFINWNNDLSKQLVVVVDIPGVPLLSSQQVGRYVQYGDPGITFGQAGLVYGGTVPVGYNVGANERSQKNLLILDSGSLSIQQRLEPEQARGSISTLSLTFLDKDGYMTQLVSPGVILPEILGQQVKIWIGYYATSWPQDYYVVWRGRIAQVQAGPGKVTLQVVDPNIIRKQQIFYCGQTSLTANITSGANCIVVSSTGNFFQKIKGPGGGYDGAVRTFIKIDDEFIEYSQAGSESIGNSPVGFVCSSANATAGAVYQDSGGVQYTVQFTISAGLALICTANAPVQVASGTLTKVSGTGDSTITYSAVGGGFSNVSRGVSPITNLSIPSVAASHSSQATVDGYIMLTGHAMDLALKIMLSGWNGAFLSNQAIYSFVTTDDVSLPTVNNGIVLPINTDAVRDLGISIGDFITISGASHPANNIYVQVTGFNDLTNQPNRVILCNLNFTAEDPSAAVIAVRSQYDTLPTLCGCQLPGWEVDVGTFQYYKNTFLLSPLNQYQFFLNSTGESGKTFVESEILLPIGAYSLTRQGKISMGLTKPPLPDQRTQTLSKDNVLEPANMGVQRGMNNRKFFNEIDWSFDCDESQTPTSQRNTIASASLNLFGLSSVLPITSKGARSGLGFLTIVANRESWLFNRYQNGSVLIDVKVNLQVGNLIEVGDIVILQDNGNLKLPNFQTGQRNMGAQYMEVINRSLDLRTGVVTLQLEGGVGSVITDRYGYIAPSSVLTNTSTASRLVIQDSFGSVFPGAEYKKWTPYVGLKVRVHSTDYLVDGTTVFTGLDPNNSYALLLSPALTFTPQSGYVMDLAQYPTNTNTTDQQYAKTIHTFLTPSVKVAAAISQTQFTVSAGDAGKFQVGLPVLFHDSTYSRFSSEVNVTNVSGTTITVGSAIGFVPDASITVELIGFADGGQPYRLI